MMLHYCYPLPLCGWRMAYEQRRMLLESGNQVYLGFEVGSVSRQRRKKAPGRVGLTPKPCDNIVAGTFSKQGKKTSNTSDPAGVVVGVRLLALDGTCFRHELSSLRVPSGHT